MQYYREYLEIMPEDGSPPYAAEVRLCHDFQAMAATDQNRVVVFDDRVSMTDAWTGRDMPTDTWGVLATS